MASTITAFYKLTATSFALSSEVANNFGLFRGDVFPYAENTGTSTNVEHNLGSTDYVWTKYATGGWNVPTTGGSMVIDGQTAAGFNTTVSTDGTDPGYWGLAYRKTTTSIALTQTFANIAGSTLTLSSVGKPVFYKYAFHLEQFNNTSNLGFKMNLIKGGFTHSSRSFENVQGISTSVTAMLPFMLQWWILSPGNTTETYYLQAASTHSSAALAETNIVNPTAYIRENW